MSRALALHQAGRLDDAEALCKVLLEAEPRHAAALTTLGTIHAQRGNFAEAMRLLDISLEMDPHQANALYNRGMIMAELKRFDEALDSYARASALEPGNPVILNNRGSAMAALKRFDEALDCYDRAIAINADYSDAFFNRGLVLSELNRHEEALDSYDRAIVIGPDDARAFFHRGNVLTCLQRLVRAVASYDRAIALDPGDPLVFNNRGNALADLCRQREALDSYDRAIALKPDYVEALFNHGVAMSELNRHEEALKSYQRAVEVRPDFQYTFPYAQGSIASARLNLCNWSSYEDTVNRAVERSLAGERAIVPFDSYMLRDSAVLHYRCAQTYSRDRNPASARPLWKGERYAHERIRLAYVSFDFRPHVLASQFAGVIEHHDRTRFETTALSLYPGAPGNMQNRLRNGFERFIDVSDESDLEVARRIRELEVDILVDLTGYTRGGRMGIFAWRPAPVQVNFNCPGTTGTDFIDYIVTDRVVVPPEHHAYYTEKVVYLPDTFQPNDAGRRIADRTPSRAEAGLPEKGFVFCSFNTSYKFRPPVFDVWMRLLLKCEGSVLWLRSPNATVVDNLRREAKARGVNPARLIFAPYVNRLEDHLARQRIADLFLDTLPYNAQTTASDALWAGLPVLTCLGGALPGRVAASALTAVGLPQLITHSLEQYETLGTLLAQEPERLRRIRDKLAANRLAFPLFDTARFTRHLETGFEQMLRLRTQGELPCHFAVAPQPSPAVETPAGSRGQVHRG